MTPVVPASDLDAADGHLQLRARSDEHGDVERPVLLGAEDLLALVEQDRLVGRVEHEQVVDLGVMLELLDRGAGGAALREGHVLRARRGSEDREDGEWSVDVRIAEAQGLGEVVVHGGCGGAAGWHANSFRYRRVAAGEVDLTGRGRRPRRWPAASSLFGLDMASRTHSGSRVHACNFRVFQAGGAVIFLTATSPIRCEEPAGTEHQ